MKVIGFSPDLDPTTDGVLTDCSAVLPSLRGIEGAPAPVSAIVPALSAACQGSASMITLAGNSRTFAATANKIYEAAVGSWNDVTYTAVGNYTTVTGRWRFAQFGSVSLATSLQNTAQASPSALFSKISGAPKADIIETVNQFVICANVVTTSFGTDPNRWFCSALGDYTNWTPSIATQCASGLLVSVPDRITALRRFGDNVIAYKALGMYFGTYTGPPFIWSFTEVPSSSGTFCQESVLNIGTPDQPRHFFVGMDNFYTFDGGRPLPVGWEVKDYFLSRLNRAAASSICMMRDQLKSRVYIYYPSGSATTPNDCLVYNYRTGKWGQDPRTVEFALEYLPAGITYDQLGTYYNTYADFPNASYDTAFWQSASPAPAIFDSSHQLNTLTGSPGPSYFVTADVGDEGTMLLLDRVKPQWIRMPATATMTNYYRTQALGEPLVQDQTVNPVNDRFDVMRTARWHRFKFSQQGPWELNTVLPSLRPDGLE